MIIDSGLSFQAHVDITNMAFFSISELLLTAVLWQEVKPVGQRARKHTAINDILVNEGIFKGKVTVYNISHDEISIIVSFKDH